MDTVEFSLGIKWLGRETDHSFPCFVEANRQLELHLHSAVFPQCMVLKQEGGYLSVRGMR
jgi:hypothetical protein